MNSDEDISLCQYLCRELGVLEKPFPDNLEIYLKVTAVGKPDFERQLPLHESERMLLVFPGPASIEIVREYVVRFLEKAGYKMDELKSDSSLFSMRAVFDRNFVFTVGYLVDDCSVAIVSSL